MSFPLLCRGKWQQTDALSEGFEQSLEKPGLMGTERFRQITSKTLCAEKYREQKIHDQNKCLGHDSADFLLDIYLPDLAGSASKEVAKHGTESGIL